MLGFLPSFAIVISAILKPGKFFVVICDLSVVALNDGSSRLRELANTLNIALVDTLSSSQELYLTYINNILCLCLQRFQQSLTINVDFVSAKLQFRQQRISLKSEPLLRAVGCTQKQPLLVLDATAGLGRDSFLLASYHCEIIMIEHSAVVAALLEDGLNRARASSDIEKIIERMHFVKQDAASFIMQMEHQPDVVYLDPMFPPRSKSAKVKKEMQVLHALLGSGEFESDLLLLQIALQKARRRVVVKRPKAADFLANKKPSYTLDTKAMRYDVYLTN